MQSIAITWTRTGIPGADSCRYVPGTRQISRFPDDCDSWTANKSTATTFEIIEQRDGILYRHDMTGTYEAHITTKTPWTTFGIFERMLWPEETIEKVWQWRLVPKALHTFTFCMNTYETSFPSICASLPAYTIRALVNGKKIVVKRQGGQLISEDGQQSFNICSVPIEMTL